MRKQFAVLLSCVTLSAAAFAATDMKLLDMVDKLDELDRNEFDVQVEKANACTRSRDFNCAQQWLAKAGKLAKGQRDRQMLQLASQQLNDEKQAVENERRRREEEEQRLALQQEQEARRRQRERDEDDDSGSTMAGVATILGMAANNYAAQLAQRRAQPAPALPLAKVESFPAPSRSSQPVTAVTPSSNRNATTQPAQNSGKQAPIGVQNVKPSAPTLYTGTSHLGPAGKQVSDEQAAQLGAATAGVPLAALDKSARPPTPASASQPAASASASSLPKPGQPAERIEPKKESAPIQLKATPQAAPPGSLSEALHTASGQYNCKPVEQYARQHVKAAESLSKKVYDAPFRTQERCEAKCDAIAWREELVSKFEYGGSWACSVSAVAMWNALDVHHNDYNDGKNQHNCTCIGTNGQALSFSPDPK